MNETFVKNYLKNDGNKYDIKDVGYRNDFIISQWSLNQETKQFNSSKTLLLRDAFIRSTVNLKTKNQTLIQSVDFILVLDLQTWNPI